MRRTTRLRVKKACRWACSLRLRRNMHCIVPVLPRAALGILGKGGS